MAVQKWIDKLGTSLNSLEFKAGIQIFYQVSWSHLDFPQRRDHHKKPVFFFLWKCLSYTIHKAIEFLSIYKQRNVWCVCMCVSSPLQVQELNVLACFRSLQNDLKTIKHSRHEFVDLHLPNDFGFSSFRIKKKLYKKLPVGCPPPTLLLFIFFSFVCVFWGWGLSMTQWQAPVQSI